MLDLLNGMLSQVKNWTHLHTSPCIILRTEAKPSHLIPAFFPLLIFAALLNSFLPFLFSLPYPPLPCPSLPSFPSPLASSTLTLLLLFLYFEIAIHAVATISIGSQVGCIVRWLNGYGTYDITTAI